MGSKQIRIGQLIAPFGPGSIYTDRRGVPHVVAGLDHWFMRWDHAVGRMVHCTDRAEFERIEPRLSALLHVNRFCCPPDYRRVMRGQQAPPNASLYVPALRFPSWYRHTRTGEMHRFNLDSARIPKPQGGGRWQPVRFISVCAAGHLCEFPWKEWIGCQCGMVGNLFLTDRGGTELTSIKVECRSCPEGSPGRRGRNLAHTTVKPDVQNGEQSAFQSAGINCSGDLPWLGAGAAEPNCNHPLIGALINQTNIYFPRTLSAIALPDIRVEDDVSQLRADIEKYVSFLGVALTRWRMGDAAEHSDVAADVKRKLTRQGIEAQEDVILQALESLFVASAPAQPVGTGVPADPESELLTFRRAEFNIIRNEVNDSKNVPDLCVISTTVPQKLAPWIAKVNLVERLRETRVFYGFDRLEPNGTPLTGMPDSAMQKLFRVQPVQPQDRWLPAIEVFGEGIYMELREDCLVAWQMEHSAWLERRLDDGFVARLSGVFQALPPLAQATRTWASRYLLVHSLAHILINQLVFECGYSTASLRERLYISADISAPMAALLVYTAAGDSEGTLGGLVRLGRPERLGPVVLRALSRASWCSADPVCSEQLGGQGSKLANLAACHACVLLPETSCETINHVLDRAMVVGTPDARQCGFMSELLEDVYTLE